MIGESNTTQKIVPQDSWTTKEFAPENPWRDLSNLDVIAPD